MNNPKIPSELALTTFIRKRNSGQLPWSKLLVETVERLRRRTDLSTDAKLTWFYLQGMGRRSPIAGCFIEDGVPMSVRDLAIYLERNRPALGREISQLVKAGFLKKDGDLLFDPIMIRNHFEENRSNFQENPKLFQEIFRKFPKISTLFQNVYDCPFYSEIVDS